MAFIIHVVIFKWVHQVIKLLHWVVLYLLQMGKNMLMQWIRVQYIKSPQSNPETFELCQPRCLWLLSVVGNKKMAQIQWMFLLFKNLLWYDFCKFHSIYYKNDYCMAGLSAPSPDTGSLPWLLMIMKLVCVCDYYVELHLWILISIILYQG